MYYALILCWSAENCQIQKVSLWWDLAAYLACSIYAAHTKRWGFSVKPIMVLSIFIAHGLFPWATIFFRIYSIFTRKVRLQKHFCNKRINKEMISRLKHSGCILSLGIFIIQRIIMLWRKCLAFRTIYGKM